MKEKNFQTKFNKWCKHFIDHTAAFELKITKTKSLSFSAVVEHQKIALYVARHNKLVYKIPDLGMQNPFDSLMLVKVPAYVVVMFYVRAQDTFYMIPIDVWLDEERDSGRKSITEERACEIGMTCSFKHGIKNTPS